MISINRSQFLGKTPSFLQSKVSIFLIVTIGAMLDLFNVTSILVAIRYIQTHYDISQSTASWTLSAYAVTFSGFIAFSGRTGDIVGHDNQFIVGCFIFGIISLICAVVENVYCYIVFRAFLGVAAATIIPSSYALVAHTFSGKQLNLAITILSGALCVSHSAGLVVGGAFLESSLKIKGIPYVSFGLSVLLSILAFFSFPIIKKNEDKLKNLDFIGSGILIGGLLLIVVGFTEAGENWNDPKAYVILVIGFVLIGAFIIYENYISPKILPNVHLLIPKPIWKIPNFLPLIFNSILNFAGFFGMIFISTSYYLYIDNDSALISGVKYLPFMITLIIMTAIMAMIYGVFSPKWTSTLGFAIGVAGIGLSTRMNYEVDNYYWKFSFPGQILLGGGSVLYFIHYLNLIITNTPLKYQGIVSGIAQTFAQFGVALSFAVITSIVGDTTDKHELHLKYRHCTYFCLGCYAAGTLLLLFFVHDVRITSELDLSSEDDLECEANKTETV